MTFYSSMIFGFCVGVVAIFGFRKLQRHKSKQRMQKAVEAAMLGSMNKDDLGKLLPKALFPSWVQFQDFERVKWLNVQMRILWPHINKATQEVIVEQVEPLLDDYRPAMITSMRFTKLTLGNVPPEIEGVQVLNTSPEQIALRVQMKWAGNPSIILQIKTVVAAGLSIQVKDVRFWGTFRIVFAPLVDQLPCFGAVTTALIEKPTVTYTVNVQGGGVGGDVSSFPGLKASIDATIEDSINDLLVWPARIVVPMMEGDFSDLEMHEVAKLDVKLVEARLDEGAVSMVEAVGKAVGKAVSGRIGAHQMNPFAKLYIRRVRGRIEESFACKQTAHPLWGQAFQLGAEDKETQKLMVELWDQGEFGQAKLGRAEIVLKDLPDLELQDMWVALLEEVPEEGIEPVVLGSVHLELTYRPFGEDGQPLEADSGEEEVPETELTSAQKILAEGVGEKGAMAAPKAVKGQKYIRGVIKVTVVKGTNLVSRDTNGLSDPFVVVNLLKSPDIKKKSKVVFKSLNPEWNETFELLVEDAKNDMLVLHVFDHDLLGRKDDMGWCALTLTEVIKKKKVEHEFPLEDGDGGVLTMRLEWWTVL